MQPVVEEFGAIFLDQYRATLQAAFPMNGTSGGVEVAIRFDRNSAFHYLDAGRYLMTQVLLHVLSLLRGDAGGTMLEVHR